MKARFPKVPALPIFLGVGFLDIIDGLLIMQGIDHVKGNLKSGPYLFFDLVFIDWDHSLVMAVALSLLWGLFFIKNKKVALLATLASFSHWLADLPMHNLDLALYPFSSVHMGYGLWGRLGVGAWILEGIFSAGLLIYAWLLFRRQNISVLWSYILLAAIFIQLSPWFSPMKKIAMLPEPEASFQHGLLVFLGFVVPGLILTWLIGRQRKMRTEDNII